MTEGSDTNPRIVVGVDGSPSSRQALRWAAHQAKLTGASLQVITCWEFPAMSWLPPNPSDFDPIRGDAERDLEVTVAEVLGDDPVLDIDLTVVEGQAAPVLLNSAGSVASRRG